MKKSEVLREAKKHLESGRACYVCFACEIVELGRIAHMGEYTPTTRYITSLIRPHSTVVLWLDEQGYPACAASAEDKRDYRLRWMDHMIAELEKEGQ